MKMRNFKYLAITVMAITTFSCEVAEPDHISKKGTGMTIMQDVLEAVGDYAEFARVGLAAKYFPDATAEEKITLFSGFEFKAIDDIWEVYRYGSIYYVRLGAGESDNINIMRLREQSLNGKPVFDTCYLRPSGKGLWELTIKDVLEDHYRYGYFRHGSGTMKLAEINGKEGLPDAFEMVGTGQYKSLGPKDKTVEVKWIVNYGILEAFKIDYDGSLKKAEMEIEAGVPGTKKDKVEAEFDRKEAKLELKVNGEKEDAYPYF